MSTIKVSDVMEMNNVVVAGVDAGSTAVKITLYNGNIMENHLCPTGWNPREAATALLNQAMQRWGAAEAEKLAYTVGTGYGRVGLPFARATMTEITCHAKGAAFLQPGVNTVIDIGGQDAKAIKVDSTGKVLDFIMNDKCAAGTGRFLQVTAHALGLDIADIAHLECASDEACTINSMCTVFAESEVIGLLNQGFSRQAIMAGLYKSIAGRIATMVSHIQPEMPVLFTGGVAQNQLLCQALAAKLNMLVSVPEKAVFAGSIGAALYAWEKK